MAFSVSSTRPTLIQTVSSGGAVPEVSSGQGSGPPIPVLEGPNGLDALETRFGATARTVLREGPSGGLVPYRPPPPGFGPTSIGRSASAHELRRWVGCWGGAQGSKKTPLLRKIWVGPRLTNVPARTASVRLVDQKGPDRTGRAP